MRYKLLLLFAVAMMLMNRTLPVEANQNATELFNEIKSEFSDLRHAVQDEEINHYIINLYLVISGARRGFLAEPFLSVANGHGDELVEKLNHIVNKYSLDMKEQNPDDRSLLITREPIDTERLGNEMYLAEMLDFGCLDPKYLNFRKDRMIYHFNVIGSEEDEKYYIMTYVCTLSHADVAEENNKKIATTFEQAIRKVNPTWHIEVRTELNPKVKRKALCAIQ